MSKQKAPEKRWRSVVTARRAILIATIMMVAVTFVSLTSHSAPGSYRVASAGSKAAASSPQQVDEEEVKITLSTSGFAPTAITHAAGTFALAVENLDVATEYILQVKAGDGTILSEVRAQKGSAVWTVDLPAGIYTLVEANHPDWACQITVQ